MEADQSQISQSDASSEHVSEVQTLLAVSGMLAGIYEPSASVGPPASSRTYQAAP
jgi:hypothetical protein